MSLLALVYLSKEERPLSDRDLLEILSKSRENNQRRDVTGMLLYHKGYFIQALEGEKETVESLYNRISQDPRHKSVMIMSREQVNDRAFSNWSMGFKNLADVDPQTLEEYREHLDANSFEIFLNQNPSRAKRLLWLFKDRMD